MKVLVLVLAFIFTSAVSYAQEKQEAKEKAEKKTEMKMDDHKNHDHTKEMKQDADKSKKEEVSKSKVWNEVCPVSGEEVDPTVPPVKFDEKEYGFCCESCIKKFKKDPAKYSKNLSEDGKTFKKN